MQSVATKNSYILFELIKFISLNYDKSNETRHETFSTVPQDFIIKERSYLQIRSIYN